MKLQDLVCYSNMVEFTSLSLVERIVITYAESTMESGGGRKG